MRWSLRCFPSVSSFAVLGWLVTVVRPHADGPPAAHTGGFNEPTCRACHRSEPLNEPGGTLAIQGLPPAGYEPARTYRLEITLTKPGMRRGGFQLSVRTDRPGGEPRQAGSLEPLDARTALATHQLGPVQYLGHSAKGAGLVSPDTARWTFHWRAPERGAPIVFHVAANAANDDNSEYGDFVYTTSLHSIPVRQ